jgi:hypothetical protein
MVEGSMIDPQFSGEWRESSDVVFTGFDACGAEVYSYQNKQSRSVKDVAQSIISEENREDCSWQKAEFTEIVPLKERPEDYPADTLSWEEITKNSNNPVTQVWSKTCTNIEGRVLDKKQIFLSPIYICPQNTRHSVDIINNRIGCSTTPDTCAADVVGRDLKYPGVSWAGHVGMTVPGWGVLEVLNDAQVIHTDHSFDDFRNQPSEYPYWGDVYDVSNSPSLTEEQALQILTIGFKQAEYDPAYTFSADYQPGGKEEILSFNPNHNQLELVQSIKRAVFRCDTFVDYAYLAGAGLQIIESFQLILPVTTYKNFIHNRFISSSPFLELEKIENKNRVSHQNSPEQTSDSLEKVFSSRDLNIELADQVVKRIKENPLISRDEKLYLFWNAALLYQKEPLKFGYLLDTLGFMYPVELEDLLMSQYKTYSDSDPGVKIKLISAIWQGAFVSPDSLFSLEERRHTLVQIQDFLSSELKIEKNPLILRELIYAYAALTPGESADALIAEKLKQIQKNGNLSVTPSSVIPPILSKEAAYRIQIRHSLMTKDSEENLFPLLLKGHKQDQNFLKALCQVDPDVSAQLRSSTQQMISNSLKEWKVSQAKSALKSIQFRDRLESC